MILKRSRGFVLAWSVACVASVLVACGADEPAQETDKDPAEGLSCAPPAEEEWASGFCQAESEACAEAATAIYTLKRKADCERLPKGLFVGLECEPGNADVFAANCNSCYTKPSLAACSPQEMCTATGCLPKSQPGVPPPPPPPLTQGDSVGDPHLKTFDGMAYDFQAVGEFLLVRDDQDGLEIQARTKIWPFRSVSTNVALAMRVADDVLAFYGNGTTRLNHEVIEFKDGKNKLPGGGEVWKKGATMVARWPDNAQAVFDLNEFISVRVYLPDTRKNGKISGLLGNFNGDPADDVAIAGAHVLTSPTPFIEFYGPFAESWRITQEQSLFDYGNGESTASFTNRNAPSAPATLDDLGADEKTAAEKVCKAASVAPHWLDACVLDVGMTGQAVFARELALAAKPSASFALTAPPHLCDIAVDRICDGQDVYSIAGCEGGNVLIETCPETAPCNAGFCLAPETAALRGLVKDAVSESPLAGVLITLRQNGVVLQRLYSGDTGLYSAATPPGEYELTFLADGYVAATMNIELRAGEVTTVTGLRQVPADQAGTGSVSGTIKDSITGEGVEGLQLAIRSGIGVTRGPTAATAVTVAEGAYVVPELPAGNYTITASGPGYTDLSFDVVSIANQQNGEQNASIAPVLEEGQLRIVLSWGEKPEDLDSHLITPEIEGSTYEISFEALGNAESAPYALLDVDDRDQFGPETITINRLLPGTYRYGVFNYSKSRDAETPDLVTSEARVQVYDHTGLAYSFVVPTTGSGLWWDVLQIDGTTGKITPVGAIADGL